MAQHPPSTVSSSPVRRTGRRARRHGANILLLALVVACASAALHAEDDELLAPLTIEEMVALAQRDNPDLASLRAQRDAMNARPAQAGALPNPMLSLGGMDRTNGGDWPDANEKRVMLQQSFPWFGKRALRATIARHDAEAMHHDVEAMTLDVALEVEVTVWDLHAVQRVLAITLEQQAVLERLATIAETMYATGRRSQQDVLKVQSEISMLRQQRLELTRQEVLLRANLNRLLNRRADASLELVAPTPSDDAGADMAVLFARGETARPETKGAAARIRRFRHERDLRGKESYPDFWVALEYRDSDRGDTMAMVTLGVELPIWRARIRAGVREADWLVSSAEAAFEATRRKVAYDVQNAAFAVLTARQSVDLFGAELIPQAEARFTADEAGYRAGKVDFPELLESERFLLNVRIMAAMAEGNLGKDSARLRRAVGGRMEE